MKYYRNTVPYTAIHGNFFSWRHKLTYGSALVTGGILSMTAWLAIYLLTSSLA
ncbi:hypothetical protein SAMN07250955_105204 [Arboricoccus pini]|uniref:Uncharacterized protein n=1 Tax=Arboricoccus pini TaxID=1963835 RepID=A0A212R4A6_9PROT|nr:hypothetical protein SAMN07250955_105204 [Arboricoccus pini]